MLCRVAERRLLQDYLALVVVLGLWVEPAVGVGVGAAVVDGEVGVERAEGRWGGGGSARPNGHGGQQGQ